MSSQTPMRDTGNPQTPSSLALVKGTGSGRWFRRIVAVLLVVTSFVTLLYSGLSIYVVTVLAYPTPTPIFQTPAQLGLQYRDITFPSREDGLMLKGWFIPGILPDGQLTAARTIIVVHGHESNRTDPAAHLLDLSAAFAQRGFAVLAFDLRGTGESPAAPRSFGQFEQRDVLGAVDFLQSGMMPYPELGRPRAIGGLGMSMGAVTLLLAAAREPAIQAIISDSAFAALGPKMEQELPSDSHLPAFFTPGIVLAARAVYGIDLYSVRPVDVVATIAPRPLFFIHGAVDGLIAPSNMDQLVAAARAAPNAHVQSWLVPKADHAQAFHVMGQAYVDRVVAFFTTWLGPSA